MDNLDIYRSPANRHYDPEALDTYCMIEIAKQHEKEESIRKHFELKFKERSERREQFLKLMDHLQPLIMLVAALVGITFVFTFVPFFTSHFCR